MVTFEDVYWSAGSSSNTAMAGLKYLRSTACEGHPPTSLSLNGKGKVVANLVDTETTSAQTQSPKTTLHSTLASICLFFRDKTKGKIHCKASSLCLVIYSRYSGVMCLPSRQLFFFLRAISLLHKLQGKIILEISGLLTRASSISLASRLQHQSQI